jgi:hypothetical protein
MAQPIWNTAAGSIGTYAYGYSMSFLLSASPITPATSITYTVVNGTLPLDLKLTPESGLISGTPALVATTSLTTFTVRATDNLGNISDNTFSISIITPQPIWSTPAGSIGTYTYGTTMQFVLSATAVAPATSVRYQVLAGTLPANIVLNTNNGLLSGTPALVTSTTVTTFTIRAIDNLNNIRDRTFTMTVTGTVSPYFTTQSGVILTTQDSIWTQLQIQYYNPSTSNDILIEVQQGELPPGLQISTNGLIQGYPNPPITQVTLPLITTVGLSTQASSSLIYCLSVTGITVGRPVTFRNTIGNINSGQTYYVKSIDVVKNAFSISTTQNGSTFPLIDASGGMNITFPIVSTGAPTIRTYNFVLALISKLGNSTASYSITVINQNTPIEQGGPGNPPNTRHPTLLNTRPLTLVPNDSDPYFGYYLLPPVAPSANAQLGTFLSNNYFAFKLIGHDFDGNNISYICSGLPLGITYDPVTGWITGTPVVASPGINNYRFTAQVVKTGNLGITSPVFNFGFNISLDINGNITWITPTDLGTIYNETLSTLKVSAVSDTDLEYRLTSGSLPPNLTLLSNGEITGIVASQPTGTFLDVGQDTSFTFTVQAYSPNYAIVQSSKTFTINVYQEYGQPTDILYIQAAPNLNDRNILATLLDNDMLIPTNLLYRPDDVNFGKATSVVYEHAYGIYASDIQDYIAAVTKNHYWRNITLGELKTAVARDNHNNIVYEVVYSEVIDNLVNPQGVSVPNEIYWPYPIDLNLGPWYTSVTDVFTSYVELLNQKYYTSLSPGYARLLYPNSLYNMRNQVASVLGQVLNSTLLPAWMTSQQINGSTLGYTQAWVICYTKPRGIDGVSPAEIIKANIETNWPYTLNQINFNIDRFTVDKSTTYNWENKLNPPAWSSLPSATPVPNPIDSENFYVLFPRQTILPDKTQY